MHVSVASIPASMEVSFDLHIVTKSSIGSRAPGVVFDVLHLLVIFIMGTFVAPFSLLFASLSLVASSPKIQPLSTLMFDGQIKKTSTELGRQCVFLCEGYEKTITSRPWDTLQALSLLYRDSRANSPFSQLCKRALRRGCKGGECPAYICSVSNSWMDVLASTKIQQ